MSTNQDTREALHDCYCQLATPRSPRFATFERSWYDFMEAGYTLEDLTVTLQFILRENKKHEWKYSLALSKLINDLQRFDDLLNEARVKERSRIKPKSNRDKVVETFRHTKTTDAGPVAQSVKDVLRNIVK